MPHELLQVAIYFLKLGTIAFGGPAAHIAMMHDEVVKRRHWLEEERFLDLLGAANLIPGPTSTELALHIGLQRAGWAGLVLGGVCFILPAMLIVMALAWAYVRFGSTAQATWILYGVKPVVIAIILQALIGLGQRAVKGWLTGIVGGIVFVLYLLGVNVLALLVAGGLIVVVGQNMRRLTPSRSARMVLPLAGVSLPALAAAPFSLSLLFLTFLKIGAVLYGSGYVLLAFLRDDFVTHLGWLTDRQLLDAIAIGQVTPGPVFTTATFIGYILAGVPGALVATLGIFLPSFVLVALSSPIIPRIRQSTWAGSILDGVNVASLGLMAGVTMQLGASTLIDPFSIAWGILSAVLLFRYRLNSTWLVAAGAVVGLGRALPG